MEAGGIAIAPRGTVETLGKALEVLGRGDEAVVSREVSKGVGGGGVGGRGMEAVFGCGGGGEKLTFLLSPPGLKHGAPG